MTHILKMTLTVMALALAAAAPAGADSTKEFLAMCKTDAKGCKDYILYVRFELKMDKQRRDLVCVPKGSNSDKVIKTITDWMSAQSELSDQDAAQSIEQAHFTLYPGTDACRATYIEVDHFPATMDQFLAYCANEPTSAAKTCYAEILDVGWNLKLDDRGSVCPTGADTKDRAAYREGLVRRDAEIRKWLGEHPELGPKPRREGIAAAYRALYSPPCSSQ